MEPSVLLASSPIFIVFCMSKLHIFPSKCNVSWVYKWPFWGSKRTNGGFRPQAPKPAEFLQNKAKPNKTTSGLITGIDLKLDKNHCKTGEMPKGLIVPFSRPHTPIPRINAPHCPSLPPSPSFVRRYLLAIFGLRFSRNRKNRSISVCSAPHPCPPFRERGKTKNICEASPTS